MAIDEIREFDYEVRELADFDQKNNGAAKLVQGISMGGRWATDDTSYLDPTYLKALFENEDWVYITVDLIAMKISNQYLRVMKQVIQDGKPVIEPAEGHPVQQLIDAPNEFQDYHAWMYTTAVDLVLLGNAIQWLRRDANRIYNIPGETVHIDFDHAGMIKQYRSFQTSDAEGMPIQRGTWVFPAKDIIHYRKPNPSSMIWGLSPFLPGQRSILFNRYSTEYLNAFYQKGASPSIVLEMSEAANEANALRLLRSFEAAYTGRRNQRRPLVTPKGVTAKPLSHSLADQQLKDYISQNRETILALLKVPPHEVGLQKAGSLGSEEYKTALQNFWAATLKPLMKIIAGKLSMGLKDQLGEDHFLEFDLTDVDALQDDKKKKADLANAMLTTRTLNEVREEVWNDPPLEGGDKTPGAVVPMLGPPPPMEVPLEEVQEQSIESKEIETAEPNIDEMIKRRAEETDRWLKSKGDWFDSRQRKIDNGQAKAEPGIYKLSLDMFEAQTIAAIKAVKKYLKDDKGYIPQRHGIRVDHVGSRKSWVTKAEIKDKKELQKKVEEAMDTFKDEWVEGYVKTLGPTLELGYDVALDVPFKIPNQDAIEAIRARTARGRRQILSARGLRGFVQMSDTSTEQIMSIIDEGVASARSVSEIIKNIVDKVEITRSRAETIARTETLTAVSLGQAAAMANAAKVIPDLMKKWLTAGDDRVRGLKSGDKYDHAGMHGQTKKYDEDFVDEKSGQSLAFPRATGADAGMVINCRCTWIMLPADEMKEIENYVPEPDEGA